MVCPFEPRRRFGKLRHEILSLPPVRDLAEGMWEERQIVDEGISDFNVR